jgi:peptidoglycan/xylan/chitin deacetylase (PgdA/CDA1 family)
MLYLRIFSYLAFLTVLQPADAITNEPIPAPNSSAQRFTFTPIHVNGPYIALTFDDGPHPELTPRLLHLLAAHHAKATFFVVGKRAAQSPQIVWRAVQEGHEIGNHSWSHTRFLESSDAIVREELQKTDAAIWRATGVAPVLMRPPGGALLARQAEWIECEFGYRTILWDVLAFDTVQTGVADICANIMNKVHPGAIILCHDLRPQTVEAMPLVLEQLDAKGFKLVTVSELLRLATQTDHGASAPQKASR